ncbi:MAG: anthranilate synthase component I [Acidobacteria bacterium]|jgi:anthranilate synthase component 1|nr:MAG: anthranilate synthase component I [Acidobacteriota bacterium]
MLSLSLRDVKALSKDYNPIPLFRELVADTETPLSLYLKLRGLSKYTLLLESVEGGIKWGRYSFIILGSSQHYAWKDGIAMLKQGGRVKLFSVDDPLQYPKVFFSSLKPYRDERLPRFWGGLVGYIGYDIIKCYEPVPRSKPDSLGVYDLFFLLSDCLVVHDNLTGSIKIVVPLWVQKGVEEEYKRAEELISKLEEVIFGSCVYPLHLPQKEPELSFWDSNFEREEFLSAVRKAKEYIAQGDIIQVVLSQRFTKAYMGRPEDLYRALRFLNPSPYMYYMDLEDIKVVGSSPEVLVRLEGGRVETRPIAGTRRRGLTPEEDLRLEEELLKDEKERAEHLMLVDLARNDVGRVAKPGSVRVEGFMRVERYSHVMHMVSDVVGKLGEDRDALDVLKALFPAGTVSGAPKVRAMQIIEELEKESRGIYAGAVGYISFEGNMDMAIAIRTALILNGKVYVQAGAGIVADSDPEREWWETVNKARALMKAVSMAEEVSQQRRKASPGLPF